MQILHNLKTLSIADMGVIPYELLVPFGQLKALNLSGNHLVNVSMQILQPVNGLEVSITNYAVCSEFFFIFFSNSHSGRLQIKRQFFALNCQKENPFIYDHGGFFSRFIENKKLILFFVASPHNNVFFHIYFAAAGHKSKSAKWNRR